MRLLKRKLRQADIFLIVANLVPVYGVWFLGWNAVEAFIVYAMETLIVGVLTLLKMLVVTLFRKHDLWYNNGTATRVSGFFFMAFFTLHYGLFAAVQTSLFSQTANITPPGSGMMHFFFHWYDYINADIAIMLAGFVISYLARSFVPFIVNGDYKRVPMTILMFQPYARIFIQQITVIAGSMFLSLGIQKGFILVFALVKTIFELAVDYDAFLNKAMIDLQKKNEP